MTLVCRKTVSLTCGDVTKSATSNANIRSSPERPNYYSNALKFAGRLVHGLFYAITMSSTFPVGHVPRSNDVTQSSDQWHQLGTDLEDKNPDYYDYSNGLLSPGVS